MNKLTFNIRRKSVAWNGGYNNVCVMTVFDPLARTATNNAHTPYGVLFLANEPNQMKSFKTVAHNGAFNSFLQNNIVIHGIFVLTEYLALVFCFLLFYFS